MKKEQTSEKLGKKRISIGLAVLAVAIVAVAASTQFYTSGMNAGLNTEDQQNPIPKPPPMALSEFGQKVVSFQDAKDATGLGKAVLPTYVPNGLTLESIRKLSEGPRNEITAVYAPEAAKTTDSSLMTKSIEDGLVITIVKDNTWTATGWNEYVRQQVEEAPDVRSSVTINGNEVMLLQNNPTYGIPYGTKVWVDGQQIVLYSQALNTSELQKVASSMLN